MYVSMNIVSVKSKIKITHCSVKITRLLNNEMNNEKKKIRSLNPKFIGSKKSQLQSLDDTFGSFLHKIDNLCHFQRNTYKSYLIYISIF